jgi:hypothetical protein
MVPAPKGSFPVSLVYEWKNEKGEIVISEKHDVPPDNLHKWQRIYSFGLSSVVGAGGSPSRPPLSTKKSSP